MFGLGMPEILLILAIALIVIGPKKLPELAKTLGHAMAEFKRSAQDFKRSIDVETSVKDINTFKSPKSALEDIMKDPDQPDESFKTDTETAAGPNEAGNSDKTGEPGESAESNNASNSPETEKS